MNEAKIVSGFIKVLKSHGFKFLFVQNAARCYGIGKKAGNERYAEIYKRKYDSECLILGKGIVCNKTISYPGGRSYFEPTELDKYLKSLPKLTPPKDNKKGE